MTSTDPSSRASSRWAVGLISGTSMDGIDAALIELRGRPQRPQVRLHAFKTMPYPPTTRRRVMRLASGDPTTSQEISSLNFILGELFARAALAVCRKGRVAPQQLTVIGSHGQTVFHQGPGSNVRGRPSSLPASTLQIGEPSIIAARTGVPVVADFRPADLAAGGHGAPLVPMVDYLLFRDSQRGIVALNIGGIANVTVIPPGAEPEDVFGFDTGPGNMVLDELIRQLTGGRKRFDSGGRSAARGRILESLLEKALSVPFFSRRPPKSAGREQFGKEFVDRCFLREKSATAEDLLCTATELTALSVANALRRFVMPHTPLALMIVSGGGAHNSFLLRRLREVLPGVEITPSSRYCVPEDTKEALAFAVLADRTLHGLPGNLPRVTGARRPVVLGKVIEPRLAH